MYTIRHTVAQNRTFVLKRFPKYSGIDVTREKYKIGSQQNSSSGK